jgi:DNA-binding LytR/AlgR family response regulator
MSYVKALIQRAVRAPVQPAWDGWLGRRDERSDTAASGTAPKPSGEPRRLSVPTGYFIAAGLLLASSVVGTFSTARDVNWRLAAPGNLWEPAMWYATSAAVILALLPLMRRAALLVRGGGGRWPRVVPAVLGLALAYVAAHIVGMFVLRQLAYAAAGWHWSISWAPAQIVYEARKDLFSFSALAAVFWLAERAAARPGAAPAAAQPEAPAELWLRDGRASILVDPAEIVAVTSAGNYVEYVLADGRVHLIRATLQAEEARLGRFGIARVHRTRLVNVKRIVALEWRPSGDFELRLDTGVLVAGSRRFREAVAFIDA